MRGLFAAPVPANAVESLFTAGRLPEEQANRAFLFEQLVRTAYPLSDSDINLVLTLLAAQSPASNELPLQ
jgi:hypothetical protein